MATRTVRDESLKTIANAIRAKAGTTEALQFPDGMVNAVKDIKTQPDLQDKTITPTAEDQTISADTGYDGLNTVTVAGDADLISANIKRGVEIFGVKGAYSGSSGAVSTKTTAKFEVNGVDYSVDGLPQSGYYKRNHELNSTIRLAYTGDKTFLHWLDDGAAILSAGAAEVDFPFNAESRAWLVTLDESIATQNPPRAYIEFMSEYSQVLGAGMWSSADSPEQHVLPKPGMKIGAKALGWTLDGQTVCTVQDIISSIDGSSAYKTIRGLYENVVIPLTITVGNNIDDTFFTVAATRGVIKGITKPSTGYSDYIVKCWSWDKEGLQPIGYNAKNYGMAPCHDTTFYIQYVPVGTPVKRLSGATLSGAYAVSDEEDFPVIVVALFDIMSNHTRVSLGLRCALGNETDAETAESALELGTGVGVTYTSTGTGKRLNYSSQIRPTAKDEVIWARAYLVYADEDGVQHTVYSPVMSWTYEELIAKDKEAGIIE